MNPTKQSATTTTDIRYKTAITQLLQVANKHKRSLFLTALVGALPLLLAIVCLAALTYLPRQDSLFAISNILLLIMILLFLITPLWMTTVNRIARIEQLLWIKSYFDGNNQESKQSLGKALDLFWPGMRLSLGMFVRYYWVFWLIVSLFYGWIIYMFASHPSSDLFVKLILLIIFSPIPLLIGYFILSQAINLRTRYVQIIFVNSYGKPDFSYSRVFSENKRLTKLDSVKGKSFGELLQLAISVDTTVSIASGAATGSVAATANIVGGKASKAAGTLIALYGSEVTSLTESLAQSIIFYMSYLAVTDKSAHSSVDAV